MTERTREIWEELAAVMSGRTFDAFFPPLAFVLVNRLYGLEQGVFVSLGLAALLGIVRVCRKQKWHYALAGMLGAGLAGGFAFFTRSAAGYYIPAMSGTAFLLATALASLLAGKPLAAWASHMARGWPLPWFWRPDIKPAYREVTLFWGGFLAVRLTILLLLYRSGEAVQLAWAGIILGWPVTTAVLILSYLYGIRRLRYLSGPGIDEFRAGVKPPWKGQGRGF